MTIDYTQPPSNIPPPPQYGGQPQPRKSSGCWKWGALGCGLVVVIIAIFIGVIVVAAFGVMKQTFVYKDAVRRAESNPQVIAALGSPIGTGWYIDGKVSTRNDSGAADVRIPIEGPKQKGKIHCVATMTGGNWKYDTLVVEPEHGPPIDLLAH